MAYSLGFINKVLDYLDTGHSVRAAAARFGIGRETAARWKRSRDGIQRKTRSHPVEYPQEIVRKVLAIAYGDHGFSVNQVAATMGISPSTISSWKKKFMDGGIMDIPEIDPDEIDHLSKKDIEQMSKEELARYVHELEVKSYVLEGTVKILKAEGIEELSNDEKAALIDARPKTITATELLSILNISSSSYYYSRSKPQRQDRYAKAREAIKEEFELIGASRGYRYIRQRLRERQEPILISGKKVRALMAEMGCLVSYAKKSRHYNSYKGEIGNAPNDLVKRNFHASCPNALWLTDVTQFSIPAGKVYLSPIIDCFDGMPVSWTISTSPDATMVNTMLEEACKTLKEGEAPMIHSDRGCHYRWPSWISICKRNGLMRSMSKKACSPDNAAMEGFFGRLKNEFFYDRNWDGVSIDKFTSMLDDYMRYYRDDRIKESLGWKSPMQYRKTLGLAA